MKELIVTIRCIAYNHEPYIRQCLEGFVMQKANFRFEAIVHDDASTDGTATIILEYAEKYPDIIKPIIETENQYSKRDGSLRRIMDAHMHGKYIALCEGDDYWTDPYKLQKQVDLLEKNLDCSFCCGGYVQRQAGEEDILKIEGRGDTSYFKFGIEDWITKWFTMPLTTIYRKNEYFTEIEGFRDKYKYFRDVHMYYHLFQIGKGIYLSENLAVHIHHLGGIASMQPHWIVAKNNNNVYREIYDVTLNSYMRKLAFNSTINRLCSKDETMSKISLFRYAWKISISFEEDIKIVKASLRFLLKNKYSRK